MIELSISVALITLIALLCVPALLNHRDDHVRVEAQLLKITCWYLQQLARAENKKFELTVTPATNSYTFNSQQHKLSPQVKFGASPQAYGPPSHTHHEHLISPVTFADNKIIFYPQGTQQAGSLYLTDPAQHAQYALTAAVAGVPYLRLYHLVDRHWQPCA